MLPSRPRSLAVLVASALLLAAGCRTPHDGASLQAGDDAETVRDPAPAPAPAQPPREYDFRDFDVAAKSVLRTFSKVEEELNAFRVVYGKAQLAEAVRENGGNPLPQKLEKRVLAGAYAEYDEHAKPLADYLGYAKTTVEGFAGTVETANKWVTDVPTKKKIFGVLVPATLELAKGLEDFRKTVVTGNLAYEKLSELAPIVADGTERLRGGLLRILDGVIPQAPLFARPGLEAFKATIAR
jgi:hypothetical protein